MKIYSQIKLQNQQLFFKMTTSGPVNDRWHNALKGDLYSTFQNHEKLFIVQTRNYKGNYIFGAFKSSVDFYLYYRNLQSKQHHEVIPGSKPQKPRFDVDLDLSKLPKGETLVEFGNKIRDSILISCSNVLLAHQTPLKSMDDFTLFTATNQEKYSVHIILSSFYHNNNSEAKEFFFRVVEDSKTNTVCDLSEIIRLGILDSGIYKSSQNFRLYLSGKNENGEIVRPKVYVDSISLMGSVHCFPIYTDEKAKLRLFRKSCITDTVGCRYIPIVVPPKKKFDLVLDLPVGYQDIITKALERFQPGEFELLEDKGTLITTKKLNPSYGCKICNRPHESLCPFITITKYGDIKIHCYRAIEYARTANDPNFFTWRRIGKLDLPPQNNPVVSNPTSNPEIEVSTVPNQTKEFKQKIEAKKEYVPPPKVDETWLIKPGKKVVFSHDKKSIAPPRIIPTPNKEKKHKFKAPKEPLDFSNVGNREYSNPPRTRGDIYDISRLPERYQQLLKS